MNTNVFVTREYLEKRLQPLIAQEQEAVQALSRAVYNHQYYIRKRGRFLKTLKKREALLAEFRTAHKRIKWLSRLKTLNPRGKRNVLVKVDSNQHAKLMNLLSKNHWHCLRAPNSNYRIPYIKKHQIKKLRKILAKRGS